MGYCGLVEHTVEIIPPHRRPQSGPPGAGVIVIVACLSAGGVHSVTAYLPNNVGLRQTLVGKVDVADCASWRVAVAGLRPAKRVGCCWAPH